MDKMCYAVQLEGHGNIMIDDAKSAEEALAIAREKLKAPDAKHQLTEVFKGQSLHEVIRG